MANLTSYEKNELRAGFDLLDMNRDGVIQQQELETILKLLGANLTEAEIAAMMRVAADPATGQVNVK